MTLPSYLEDLKRKAEQASAAEDAFRREIATRTRQLERERAFAFRRLNLMRAVAEGVASADSEEIAVAAGAAMLRGRLGWSSDSEARSEVISRFVPVSQAMFSQLMPEKCEGEAAAKAEPHDVAAALVDFESWYEATHPVAFWTLFENVMPETPVVDF